MIKNTGIHRIFSTPIIQFSFSDHNKYFFTDIEKSIKKPDCWIEPLNTSFPNITKNDSFITEETTESLKTDLLHCISSNLNNLHLPNNIFFSGFWYNVYHDNQGQESHNHMPGKVSAGTIPYWCGIYFNKNSSPTIFYQHDEIKKLHSFLGDKESDIKDCFWEYYYPNVSDGDIVLFPPYLWHGIKTNETHKDKMRLTFAFNIDLITS